MDRELRGTLRTCFYCVGLSSVNSLDSFPTLYIMAVLTECSTYFQMMNSYFEAQNAVVAAGKGNGLLPIHLDTFGLGNGLTVSFSTSETMSTTAILV